MEKTFKEGAQYSGEVIYGCSGNMSTNTITVLKLDGEKATFQQNFGLEAGQVKEGLIEKKEKWGEYIETGGDRFFAYAINNFQS